MYHFFTETELFTESEVTIVGSDVNHIKNVLRMKPGEKVLISDGKGLNYFCELTEIGSESVKAEILPEEVDDTELPVEVVLYQGLPKGDKMELIIQKCVELGVSRIVPVDMARCVMKLDPKKEGNKIKRWYGVSESAAKQSRRTIIPEVSSVMSFKEAINRAKEFELGIIPYENFKDMTETKEVLKKVQKGIKIGIFIGPEGGFEESEIQYALENGIYPISLGKRILRTETAGLAILSVLMFQLEN